MLTNFLFRFVGFTNLLMIAPLICVYLQRCVSTLESGSSRNTLQYLEYLANANRSTLRKENSFKTKVKPEESIESSETVSNPQMKLPKPYALSPTYLIYLAKAEMEIYKELGNYVTVLTHRLKLIRKYIEDYEDSSGKVTGHIDRDVDHWGTASHLVAHPVIAYRMVRRFSREFHAVTGNIWQNYENRIEQLITNLGGESSLPSKKDNEDGMEAILRLHYIYGLDLVEFTNGSVAGVLTDVGLSTHQVFEIAKYATDNGYFSLAHDWLQLTASRMKTENNTGISVFTVENAFKKNMELHDENFKDMMQESHPYIFTAPLSDSMDKPTTVREIAMKTLPGTDPPLRVKIAENEHEKEISGEELRKYEANHYTILGLCNGENYQTERYKIRLTCWYDSTRSHYFGQINPLKVELLNKDPILLQIYDVIVDTWINKLIQKVLPILERVTPNSNSTYRTASYAYLSDEDIKDIPISRHIELITNLNVYKSLASEHLQIASYAYGGHVEPHVDTLSVSPEMMKFYEKGDLMTTFLIYLNEVERGGYTVFPYLKMHVKPVKGSALMWHVALKNGEKDERMQHAACPVIFGHKWIATKGINLNENIWKRPCDLDPNL